MSNSIVQDVSKKNAILLKLLMLREKRKEHWIRKRNIEPWWALRLLKPFKLFMSFRNSQSIFFLFSLWKWNMLNLKTSCFWQTFFFSLKCLVVCWNIFISESNFCLSHSQPLNRRKPKTTLSTVSKTSTPLNWSTPKRAKRIRCQPKKLSKKKRKHKAFLYYFR